MKRSNTLKKHRIILPQNFQELVILKEMKFSGGDRGIDLIRELLYLYSLGMEYYDSINNPLLYSHYCQRNTNMLVNPEVISVLDQSEGKDISVKIEVIHDHPYKIISNRDNAYLKKNLFKQNSLINNQRESEFWLENEFEYDKKRKDSTSYSEMGHSSSHYMEKKQINQELKKGVQTEFEKLETKLNNIENILDSDIVTQKSSFEERKKRKQDKIRNKPRKSHRFMVRKGSKLDDILVAVVAHNHQNQMIDNEVKQHEILKGIMELSENKLKTAQALMTKEIEDFIEKNMDEMHKALEELRISFEEEIKSVDEDVFPDVVRGLREDMTVELENLKEQYEEHRREGVDKIKAKHNSKK